MGRESAGVGGRKSSGTGIARGSGCGGAAVMTDHDRIRLDLCCAARLLYRNGLSAANAGHISVAIGGGRMLVNHFGPSFATLRPPNLVIVDFSGKVIDGDAYVNDPIPLHGTIPPHKPKPPY